MDMTAMSSDVAFAQGKKIPAGLKVSAEATEKERQAVKKVAREFEALFTEMMLKSMRETVGKDSLTGGGRGEEIYRMLLDQEYARAAAEQGSLGLAKLIETTLTRPAPGPPPAAGLARSGALPDQRQE